MSETECIYEAKIGACSLTVERLAHSHGSYLHALGVRMVPTLRDGAPQASTFYSVMREETSYWTAERAIAAARDAVTKFEHTIRCSLRSGYRNAVHAFERDGGFSDCPQCDGFRLDCGVCAGVGYVTTLQAYDWERDVAGRQKA